MNLIYKSNNIEIDYIKENEKESLYFKFIGKFTEAASLAACDIWKEEFNKKNSHKTYLIWDCTEMDGFENKAKNDWMDTMKALEDKIELVTVISDNIIVRGVCHIMSRLYSFDMKILKSYE